MYLAYDTDHCQIFNTSKFISYASLYTVTAYVYAIEHAHL